MEPAENISEEWSSLGGLYSAEEADFMTQFLDGSNSSVSAPEDVVWPDHESTLINNNSYHHSKVANNNTNFFCFSQGISSSTDSGNFFPTTSSGTYSFDPIINFGSMSMGFCLGHTKFSPHSFQRNDSLSKSIDKKLGLHPEILVLADNNFQANRQCEMLVSEPAAEDRRSNQESPAKRFKSSTEVSKLKKNAKSEKNPKSASMSNNEEDRSAGHQGQSSSSCFSEDESSASLELSRVTSSSLSPTGPPILNLNRTSKPNKGPATDPQSLYARRRRERINDRLRILQNLVPNGTKVDISTMLEEAVQYVKFLQLQIKLLSSDDLWMYAPIAYNGMNIGPDLNISPSKQTTIGRSHHGN